MSAGPDSSSPTQPKKAHRSFKHSGQLPQLKKTHALTFKGCRVIFFLKNKVTLLPFCRKCGRRLPEYSKICKECGTSTTAPLIRIKKSSGNSLFKAVSPARTAKGAFSAEPIIAVKVSAPAKPAKADLKAKKVKPAKTQSVTVAIQAKPIIPAVIYPPHEIIKSNVSLKEDITSNPRDYERQSFNFDLECSRGHFWAAGELLPVSNGKAYCLKCGERLRKPNLKRKIHRRYQRYPQRRSNFSVNFRY
jgi:hypothetical protein